jgi:hypothetical protein
MNSTELKDYCIHYIPSPELSDQDDDFDTQVVYQTGWFGGKTRLTGYEIKPGTCYTIRFKNDTNRYGAFNNYYLVGFDKDTVILRQAELMTDLKMIKLDINNIYAYQVCKSRL